VAVAAMLLATGCELFASIEDRRRPGEPTTTSSGGGGGEGGSAPDCATIYVAPAGDDSASGCAPVAPKRTVAAALEDARVSGAVEQIVVCAGVYDEALVLDVPVDLRGGFDCTSWTRTATYGYPTFDGANETRIGGSQQPEALRITGAAVGPSTVVDGVTILGPAEGQDGGAALRIEESAAPEVTSCRVLGGGTQRIAADGSIGLLVTSGATPDVHHNAVDGGTGITFGVGGVGRAGIVVEEAGPSIHDNRITGGDDDQPESSDGIPSAGVVLRDADDLTLEAGRPFRDNVVDGGSGDGKMAGIATAGMLVGGDTDIDIVDNVIRAGDSPGFAVEKRGIQSQSTGELRIVGNRIYGGDLSDPANPNLGFRVGIWLVANVGPLIENNMIHGGVAEVGFSGGSPSFALSLDNVQGAVIRHNTIYSGPSGFPTVGTALKTFYNVSGTIVQNNILAADGGWNEPVWSEQCASMGVFQTFENNLLLNSLDPSAPAILDQVFGYGGDPQGNCFGYQGVDTIDDLEAHFAGAGMSDYQGNVTLRADCGTDGGCITRPGCAATTSLDCLQSVFEEWSEADNGVGTLFGPGWKLASGVPCAIAESSLDLTAVVDTDLFGAARTLLPSMGAHELDALCSP
jgi:hypothetical protein